MRTLLCACLGGSLGLSLLLGCGDGSPPPPPPPPPPAGVYYTETAAPEGEGEPEAAFLFEFDEENGELRLKTLGFKLPGRDPIVTVTGEAVAHCKLEEQTDASSYEIDCLVIHEEGTARLTGVLSAETFSGTLLAEGERFSFDAALVDCRESWLEMAETTLDFGAIQVGESRTEVFPVTNLGLWPFTARVQLRSEEGPENAFSSEGEVTILPRSWGGSRGELLVTFSPRSPGSYGATATVETDAVCASPLATALTVTGVGREEPDNCAGGRISGQIASDCVRVEGAEVTVFGGSREYSQVVGRDGRFELCVPEGEYVVMATLERGDDVVAWGFLDRNGDGKPAPGNLCGSEGDEVQVRAGRVVSADLRLWCVRGHVAGNVRGGRASARAVAVLVDADDFETVYACSPVLPVGGERVYVLYVPQEACGRNVAAVVVDVDRCVGVSLPWEFHCDQDYVMAPVRLPCDLRAVRSGESFQWRPAGDLLVGLCCPRPAVVRVEHRIREDYSILEPRSEQEARPRRLETKERSEP